MLLQRLDYTLTKFAFFYIGLWIHLALMHVLLVHSSSEWPDAQEDGDARHVAIFERCRCYLPYKLLQVINLINDHDVDA